MRATTLLGVAALAALPLAACEQTVYLNYDGSVPVDAGSFPTCNGTTIQPKQVETLEIIVAMDRSMGMSAAKFGDTTALAAARDAIDQNAALNQNVLHFGYVEFPGNYLCTSMTAGCCASSVAPPSPTIDGFDFALRSCDPPTMSCAVSGQRATTAALRQCMPTSFMQSSRRSVLLITNGQPDCSSGQDTPCNEARNATQMLAQYGVATYVVAPNVTDTDTISCLKQIAAYGGGSLNFYSVSDPTSLGAAIDSITHPIAQMACHLDVRPAQIRNPDSGSAVLVWKGQVVPYNPNGYNGWDLTMNQNGSTIDLNGMWCERLIDGGPGDFTLLTDCPTHR